MKHELTQFAQALPFPALLLEGGTVAFLNTSAESLFGGHLLGMSAPAIFGVDLEAGAEAAFSWSIAKKSFHVSIRFIDRDAAPPVRLICLTDGAGEEFPPALQALPALGRTLRGTLSTAFAALPALMDSVDRNDEALCRQAGRLHQSMVALNRLASNIFDVPHLLRGEMVLSYETVELTSLLRGLLEESEPWLKHRDLSCVLECSEKQIRCVCDRSKIERMFLNLLSNAIKYSPTGGHIRICLGTVADNATIKLFNAGRLTVDLDELYTRYTALRPDPAEAGFGLGLLFSKTIAEKHGGTLMVTTTESGVEAVVSLPLRTTGARPLRSPYMQAEHNAGYKPVTVELSDAAVGPQNCYRPK